MAEQQQVRRRVGAEDEVIEDATFAGQDIEAVEPETFPNHIVDSGDPHQLIIDLEAKASLAPRMKRAHDTIIASQTFAGDWKKFGDKWCLSSAGAERIGRLFGVEYTNVKNEKQLFNDTNGPAYRYVYTGYAKVVIGNSRRKVYVEGIYGSRDKFLGFADNQWKSVEDISENDVRRAAYHIFIGNGIKALLGIRNIPDGEFQKILGGAGMDSSKANATKTHASGTKGGTSTDDRTKQARLVAACYAIVDAGFMAEVDPQNDENRILRPLENNEQDVDRTSLAQSCCETISCFLGDKGWVKGRPASKLAGKWLNRSINTAEKLCSDNEIDIPKA